MRPRVGAVHVVACPRALEVLTGADFSKLFPIPDISNRLFMEAKVLEDQGLHLILYRNNPKDFARVGEVWNPYQSVGKQAVLTTMTPSGTEKAGFSGNSRE